MPDHPAIVSRSASRTHDAIVDALVALMQGRRYHAIRTADLIAHAGIGKSTFYDHFRSKDEVLLEAMRPILLALATAASGRAAQCYVCGMVRHLWDRRSVGRPLMASSAAPAIQRRLAQAIRPHVERSGCPAGASIIVASGIAAAQLAMLRSWLAGEAASTPDQMADRLIACAHLVDPDGSAARTDARSGRAWSPDSVRCADWAADGAAPARPR